jgi:bifunctional DNase/RNase
MIEVKMADVIPTPKDGYYTVMLHDEAGHRVLPIAVSTAEGLALTVDNKTLSPRPTPTDFMANVLAATGVNLDEIRIESLKQHSVSKQNILYAVAKVRNGHRVNEVETRGSEAIAVAHRTGSTIFVKEEILDRVGYRIPEGLDTDEQMLQSLARHVFEFEGYQVTERVLRIIGLARQEAYRLQHHYVGSEHLLLAIIREGEGTGVDVLLSLDMILEESRSAIEGLVNHGNKAAGVVVRPSFTEKIHFVPRTQQVLDFAMQEAQTMGAEIMGSGHVLLGLAQAKSGVASQLLHKLGFNYERIRDEFNRISRG